MPRAFEKDYLIKGMILGVLCFLAFWVQTIGLDNTTPGKNAFLTATYCVIVPFAWWAIARKRPTAFNLIAAVTGCRRHRLGVAHGGARGSCPWVTATS